MIISVTIPCWMVIRFIMAPDDNASGVSAVLQIVRSFLATGKQPERTVIFAFWDGEEKGLLGSKYFAQSFPQIKQVKGYLNFDMIGRNNDESRPWHVVYFFTKGTPAFGEWLKEDIEHYNLNLQPDYRAWDNPVGGSDNGTLPNWVFQLCGIIQTGIRIIIFRVMKLIK